MGPRSNLALVGIFLVAAGCAGPGPAAVFHRSTEAFARGDVKQGTADFSKRLRKSRPLDVLTAYYASPQNQRKIRYLLENCRFHMVREDGAHAIGQVTWPTGHTELVHFVREDDRWKLDLPPDPTTAADRPPTRETAARVVAPPTAQPPPHRHHRKPPPKNTEPPAQN